MERIIAEVEARVREVAAVRQPAAQKLAAFIQAMKVDSAIGREISDYMHKPQNALLHQKNERELPRGAVPLCGRHHP